MTFLIFSKILKLFYLIENLYNRTIYMLELINVFSYIMVLFFD
jgi:hypothetical protein